MSDLDITIGNRALQHLGVSRITSFDDPSKQARALSANYASERDELLASHPWAFAIARTTLQLDAAAPAFGFNCRYALPADCLAVIELPDGNYPLGTDDYRGDSDAPYAVEGGYLLTDIGAPLKLRYLKAVTSGFDPLFSAALAWRLAVSLALELTNSEDKLAQAEKGFVQAMALARQRNAIQKPSDGPLDDSWVLGRL